MKVLVAGGGGREHALVWKLAADPSAPEVFCAPGNAGTAALAQNVAIAAEDVDALADWAGSVRPDLTVIGPEAPLCAGLADRLASLGLRVFGPAQAAARIEGSKIFSKDIMQAAGVPTAAAERFNRPDAALDCLRRRGAPLVVKADGLAAGKGVYVCRTRAEAEEAVREILVGRVFGAAGNALLIEDCVEGEEASILALVDGRRAVMLASSQDHKRAFDGDLGPNTGGMGAYSPAPVVTADLWPLIRERVFERTLAELRRRGIVFRGVLYAGLMIRDGSPKVLEFNCRFGDPETQVILPRIDGSLIPALQACVDGCLDDSLLRWRPDPCACVVMASGGYPGPYARGKPIGGLAEAGAVEGVTVFHAGTALDAAGATVTAGGRVLGVTALGADLRQALARAYSAAAKIEFEGAHYRTDIGRRALGRA